MSAGNLIKRRHALVPVLLALVAAVIVALLATRSGRPQQNATTVDVRSPDATTSTTSSTSTTTTSPTTTTSVIATTTTTKVTAQPTPTTAAPTEAAPAADPTTEPVDALPGSQPPRINSLSVQDEGHNNTALCDGRVADEVVLLQWSADGSPIYMDTTATHVPRSADGRVAPGGSGDVCVPSGETTTFTLRVTGMQDGTQTEISRTVSITPPPYQPPCAC